ncbi:MAG: hypothetical protein H7831_06905 [Magnetococcus sp. WYHC-3]
MAKWQAPDHPCYGNGGDPENLPHPFMGLNPDTHEVIVLTPDNIKDLKAQSKKSGKDVLDYITKDTIEPEDEGKWPDVPVTVGIEEDEDIIVTRKKIPKQPYFKHYRIRP